MSRFKSEFVMVIYWKRRRTPHWSIGPRREVIDGLTYHDLKKLRDRVSEQFRGLFSLVEIVRASEVTAWSKIRSHRGGVK